MKKSEKEILNKSIIRSVLLLMAVFSFMMGILITIESLTSNREKKEALVTYETFGKIDYRINLKENEIYDDEYIESKNIITKLIDNMEIDFEYEVYSSKELDSQVKYLIKATVINNYTIDNKKEEILSKEFEIIPETTIVKENSVNTIHNEKVSIDYNYYNELAKKIRQESGVLTDAVLKVEIVIENDLELSNSKEMFSDNHTMSLVIPLLENVATITEDGEFEDKETLYNISTLDMNYFQLTIGIMLLIVSICFIYTAIKMFVDINNISHYIIEKNRILRRYGDIIAETSTKPELKNLEVMEITNIIDLVNIEDELRIPIIFYEILKDRESWFIIIHNDKVYRYILKKKKNTKNA